jgi:hypothetical protein
MIREGLTMKMGLLFLMVLSALITGGCATLPEKIAPLDISDVPYQKWSCEQLSREQPKLAASLATASDAQRRCRKTDIAGVLFIGLPVATLTGFNRSSEIARLKGELQALQHAAILENCPLTSAQSDTSLQAAAVETAASGDSEEKK